MQRSPLVRAAAVLSAILLVVIGWYLGSPLFIRTTANEVLPTAATPARSVTASAPTIPGPTTAPTLTSVTTVLRRGELQYVDSLHNGKGTVLILAVDAKQFLRFEEVAITNAPDVHVYLAKSRDGAWSEQQSTYIGPLKATNGSFNYELPVNTDIAAYGSVVVWCRAFSVLVSWANLERV